MGGDNDSIDWTTDDDMEVLGDTAGISSSALTPSVTETTFERGEASSSAAVSTSDFKLVNHFVAAGFPEELVVEAIKENGRGDEHSILNILLNLTNCGLEDAPQQHSCFNSDPSSPGYDEKFLDDFSSLDGLSDDERSDSDSLFEENETASSAQGISWEETSEKESTLLFLANMGFPVEEASIAIERCGSDASLADLVDFLGAAQLAREEDCCLLQDDIKLKRAQNQNSITKKRKHDTSQRRDPVDYETTSLPTPMTGFGVPSMQLPGIVHRSLSNPAKGPPYFFYENVALAPKGTWDTISRFLYDVRPEFVDSKYFCAAARKRGYIHNLPIEDRYPLVPIPPLTIQEAFPLSKKWWPRWDVREKLNCIQTCIASAKLTERIRAALEMYEDDPPAHVQKYVLYESRKWNLVWVGRNKLAPLEPDEIEMLLGFPKNHTRGGGISRTDRYKSLGNSFQVDTVAYQFSILKRMFPDGINMLSLFSGIGGAEVALHRLGIRLNNVVSVEKSKVNRDIVRSWWEQTNQTGNLIDLPDVHLVDRPFLEKSMRSFGGFDLIVGGSPCNNLAGSNRHHRDGLEGNESSLFYEYFRILDLVRIIMGR